MAKRKGENQKRKVVNLGIGKEVFGLLERAKIEFEIEMLKRKMRRWEIVEIKLSLPLIKAIANLSEEKPMRELDWSKAGEA